MVENAVWSLDTTLIRMAVWLNIMHWFNLIVNMDENKNKTREKQYNALGLLLIVLTIVSEIIKWLYIDNGTQENTGFLVILFGKIFEGYILTIIPIVSYIYIYARLSENFTLIISNYN
jgi:hypothetical protein